MDPGKATFGHFIDFGHFPIEIPIEAEKLYGKWKEVSYSKIKTVLESVNKMEQLVGLSKAKFGSSLKIRITLVLWYFARSSSSYFGP